MEDGETLSTRKFAHLDPPSSTLNAESGWQSPNYRLLSRLTPHCRANRPLIVITSTSTALSGLTMPIARPIAALAQNHGINAVQTSASTNAAAFARTADGH